MRARRSAAVSWALAIAAAIALGIGGLLMYAERALFSSDGFADRTAAALGTAPVGDAVAGRLTDAVIGVSPDLVALRPIVELAARGVVRTAGFRSLVRRAALGAHRSAFDRDADDVTIEVRDAGILLAAAVRRLRPDAAGRVPTGVRTTLVRVHGAVGGFLLALAERAESANAAKWAAFGAAVLLALAALLFTDSRRASVFRLGVALASVGAVVALSSAVIPDVVASRVPGGDRAAVRAAIGTWFDPIAVWGIAASGVGLLAALAAASVLRPIAIMPPVRRISAAIAAPPRNAIERGARTTALLGLGAAMVAWPRDVVSIAVVALGIVLFLFACSELLALAGGGAATSGSPRRRGPPRSWRIGAAVLLLATGVVAAAAIAAGIGPTAPRTERCNGHASLCDRRLDEIALLGTHNAMAAAGEPGWLFAAQDAGISQQLEDGVRAFTIDTHYGIGTARGVATDLSGETKSRAKLVDQLGARFVATAERLRARLGRRPEGKREVYLCHAFCEVGATQAVEALTAMHRFLVTHPEEVVVLSIEDDTSAADTAAVIRASGLVDEVYLGDAKPPWPTLRELVDRDERVIVLTENEVAPDPWIHHQPAVIQETPYRFTAAAELGRPSSCAPNRGGSAGSLLLVNHWLDTSPAPRPTLARRVNAHEFISGRLSICQSRRRMLANIVAVDFYRQGDALRAVNEINRVE
jgi:hypothetical protein